MLPGPRFWNIALRSGHLAAMSVLVGGHAFDVPKERLLAALALTVASGLVLTALETGGSLVWFHQGRGLATLAKLGLLVVLAVFAGLWPYRLWILLAVVVLASVGSHMPARLRYYSVLYREVIPGSGGPGAGRLAEAAENGDNAGSAAKR